ncbi:phosphomannomutase [Vibrio sp. 1640]|uniref:phosphomannomutase n=1 Tax=Vibrio sp. 1640 TaxID=3074570 RepID=UPI0029648D4D|nr:phosphomannomutase [Vibrio sp. 1640]MDW2080749.1 phosphomannomutase [Vibrio sp. 1640]
MKNLQSNSVIQASGIQFGTSGARGLVNQFSSDACVAFTHAFISSIADKLEFKKVAIAIDNRPSSPAMAQACIQAIQECGFEAVYYGVIPTPALAYSAMQDNIPCIMVTGSHIPFDRNGLKFYCPDGEITKADEQAILNASVEFTSVTGLPELEVNPKAAQQYVERYTSLFEADLLTGKRIGIYEHSSAGRDLYPEIFTKLGAEVISLARSDEFVPIDTEAVSDEDKAKAKAWSKDYKLDFIFSTDGDGDRPLVADENGEWLRGDILGLLCAEAMQVEALALPVSCNTVIDASSTFSAVSRTKIGSPYVIEEFSKLAKTYQTIAGFEANGGFLLGSDVEINGKTLKALPTRDALLPALMLLAASKETGIAPLVNALAPRFTDSDRIQNFATEISEQIITQATGNEQHLLTKLGFDNASVENVDTTDGLRLTMSGGDIIHLRPSGNAPELRCYAESSSVEKAHQLVRQVLTNVQHITVSER